MSTKKEKTITAEQSAVAQANCLSIIKNHNTTRVATVVATGEVTEKAATLKLKKADFPSESLYNEYTLAIQQLKWKTEEWRKLRSQGKEFAEKITEAKKTAIDKLNDCYSVLFRVTGSVWELPDDAHFLYLVKVAEKLKFDVVEPGKSGKAFEICSVNLLKSLVEEISFYSIHGLPVPGFRFSKAYQKAHATGEADTTGETDTTVKE